MRLVILVALLFGAQVASCLADRVGARECGESAQVQDFDKGLADSIARLKAEREAVERDECKVDLELLEALNLRLYLECRMFKRSYPESMWERVKPRVKELLDWSELKCAQCESTLATIRRYKTGLGLKINDLESIKIIAKRSSAAAN